MIALENRLRGPQASSAAGTDAAASSDRALLADLVAKIGTVESQMRTLTGRLEEIEYRMRQQDQAMERMRQEMDLQQQAMLQAQLDVATQQSSNTSDAVSPVGQKPVSQPAETSAAGAGDSGPSGQTGTPVVALPEGDEAAQYQYAFDFIKANDLQSGFTAMELFLKAHPEGALAGNAKFWLGRIHLRLGRMPQAAQQLLALIEEHPNHEKRADALVDLADVLIALDSASDACNALAEFRRSSDTASPRLKARAERTAASAGCNF